MPFEAPLAARIREIAEGLRTRPRPPEAPAVDMISTGTAPPPPPAGESFSCDLDLQTVRELLGPAPSWGDLSILHRAVGDAVHQLEQEIKTGRIAPGPRLVFGRPLADYLSLDDLARLLKSAAP